jgi:small subunit ribosomal protein S7
MPRRREVPKRKINPDPVYNDRLLAKFTNIMMLEGKKTVAEAIVYAALENVQEKTGEDPLRVFKKALENVKPAVEVKSRRVGGANYQVPVEIRGDRRTALAMRWLRDFARNRNERTMKDRLASEIREAYENRGGAVKKKDDTHRMAEANKAFAHYRW